MSGQISTCNGLEHSFLIWGDLLRSIWLFQKASLCVHSWDLSVPRLVTKPFQRQNAKQFLQVSLKDIQTGLLLALICWRWIETSLVCLNCYFSLVPSFILNFTFMQRKGEIYLGKQKRKLNNIQLNPIVTKITQSFSFLPLSSIGKVSHCSLDYSRIH